MWNQLTDPENQTREYLAAKAREMAEMEAFMKGLSICAKRKRLP